MLQVPSAAGRPGRRRTSQRAADLCLEMLSASGQIKAGTACAVAGPCHDDVVRRARARRSYPFDRIREGESPARPDCRFSRARDIHSRMMARRTSTWPRRSPSENATANLPDCGFAVAVSFRPNRQAPTLLFARRKVCNRRAEARKRIHGARMLDDETAFSSEARRLCSPRASAHRPKPPHSLEPRVHSQSTSRGIERAPANRPNARRHTGRLDGRNCPLLPLENIRDDDTPTHSMLSSLYRYGAARAARSAIIGSIILSPVAT